MQESRKKPECCLSAQTTACLPSDGGRKAVTWPGSGTLDKKKKQTTNNQSGSPEDQEKKYSALASIQGKETEKQERELLSLDSGGQTQRATSRPSEDEVLRVGRERQSLSH